MLTKLNIYNIYGVVSPAYKCSCDMLKNNLAEYLLKGFYSQEFRVQFCIIVRITGRSLAIHFTSLLRKNRDFLTFSGSVEMEHNLLIYC